jgi:hypothetical protein
LPCLSLVGVVFRIATLIDNNFTTSIFDLADAPAYISPDSNLTDVFAKANKWRTCIIVAEYNPTICTFVASTLSSLTRIDKFVYPKALKAISAKGFITDCPGKNESNDRTAVMTGLELVDVVVLLMRGRLLITLRHPPLLETGTPRRANLRYVV